METSLGKMAKPRFYKKLKISQMWWHMPVVSATQKAEVGELPEPREVDAAVSCECATAFQHGQQSETLFIPKSNFNQFLSRKIDVPIGLSKFFRDK